MKTFCRQIKYYERVQIATAHTLYTPGGWTVRIELEDNTSFNFHCNEISSDEHFIVIPDEINDPTFEDYPEITTVDWSKVNVDWGNIYTMLAIWKAETKDERPKGSIRIVCKETAYDNFWEEIWPSYDDTSLLDP